MKLLYLYTERSLAPRLQNMRQLHIKGRAYIICFERTAERAFYFRAVPGCGFFCPRLRKGDNMKLKILKYIAADIAAAAILLCIFSYFHHVRMLWNLGGHRSSEAVEIIEKPQDEPPLTSEQDETETSVHVTEKDPVKF